MMQALRGSCRGIISQRLKRSFAITTVNNRGNLRQNLTVGVTTSGPLAVNVTGGGTLCVVLGAAASGSSLAALSNPSLTGLNGTWVLRGSSSLWPASSTKVYMFTCSDYTPGAGTITANFDALPNTQTVGFVVDEVQAGKTVVQAKPTKYTGAGDDSPVSLDVAPNPNSLIWGYFAVGLHTSSSPRVEPGSTMGIVDLSGGSTPGFCFVTAYKLGTTSTPGTLNFDMNGGTSSYRHVGVVEIAA